MIIFAYKSSGFLSSGQAIADLTFASKWEAQCQPNTLGIKVEQSSGHSSSGCSGNDLLATLLPLPGT